MNPIIEIVLTPEEKTDEHNMERKIGYALGSAYDAKIFYRILKRSLDARKSPLYRYRIEVSDKEIPLQPSLKSTYKNVTNCKSIIIVGAGPAGYFAALECLALGLKPIIIERGKNVRDRRRDLKGIQQDHIVNPDSNYCFGEGGAGTYSDGKLYTRSGKRGDINKVNTIFVEHGASAEILFDAHPHIGSNKLPDIIQNMRSTIEEFGGQIHFDQKVIDFSIQDGVINGVTTNSNEYHGEAVILATGHSARDIFELMHHKNLLIESKSFALGVRIEHPQSLIDSIQYHQKNRHDQLPAAAYSLACTINDRGVFSFCMCPGGLMVPAATSPGEIVINGMSLSRRDSKFANSGIVVGVHPLDFQNSEFDPFCGLNFQKRVEQHVFQAGDGSQKAPAQRLTDFMKSRISASLPDSSYIPGLWSAPIDEILPSMIVSPLKEGIKLFTSKMKGFYTEEAVVVATESRTSSPIRIPRNSLSMHPQCAGLIPCGEGAGYAGGIMSAAMDGQHCARAAYHYVLAN
ncbi:MAG: FAD-dependent protein [Saprospiraceae bacterium]